MKNKKFLKNFLMLSFVFLFCLSSFAFAKVTAITEDLRPLNYTEGGSLKGPAVEIVFAIQKKLGGAPDVKVYPWARGYKLVQTQPNIALFSTTRTPQRERMFKWVGPLAVKKWMFFAKKGSGITIASINDAKDVKSIGVVRADVSEQDLTSKGFKNLYKVSKQELVFKMLMAERIDLAYTSAITAKMTCQSAGVDWNNVEPVYTVKSAKLYIAFSKSTPDATVRKWQNAYNQLKADGTIRNIYKKYGLLVLYPN